MALCRTERPQSSSWSEGALVSEARRAHFFRTATMLLSVALAKNTANSILLERTEATLLGYEKYDDFNLLEWSELCCADWSVSEGPRGAPDVP